ncbi:hypothetical protein TRICI_003145 [Trichomonascus ciferrii]|uniref:Subtelomeric hrmA-associated cluster protein AFUB-079030/YDR124W-like helical bundle domain-containing protein n=1 Tax=Trichomonascus ciferrii TaxID=44093 RepID=A0A642VAW7_9ASCO|nr:hypothetical protein TRICI_003145 [Trichomonascus ciferrii]
MQPFVEEHLTEDCLSALAASVSASASPGDSDETPLSSCAMERGNGRPGCPMTGYAETVLNALDDEALTEHLRNCFETMQQKTCREVVKTWIKVIEPGKQSRCPYKHGDTLRPSWWPPGLRHKEPDHLHKPERLRLMLHLLRLPYIDIAKLRNATDEYASRYIRAGKQELLDEVYFVAEMERWAARSHITWDNAEFVASRFVKTTKKSRRTRSDESMSIKPSKSYEDILYSPDPVLNQPHDVLPTPPADASSFQLPDSIEVKNESGDLDDYYNDINLWDSHPLHNAVDFSLLSPPNL